MTKKVPQPTSPPKERAFLVGTEIRGDKSILSMEDSLAELALLCSTAGLEVVGELTQKIDHPNPETLIGSGKVAELKALVEDTLAQVVVFDDELRPRNQRELERALGINVRILDRSAVILDIFAQHAKTSDGQLQVKLAQYEYYLPRLTGQWTHLARQAGGGGGRSGGVGGVGLRGPGETQLEVDRRSIRQEIAHLNKEIEKLRMHRSHYRMQRKRANIPIVALVGYTNAGKSTLLNRLARTNIYAADQLFATLDPTTRRVFLSGNQQALFTDTVGFIQKLPTTLIAAFRATLEEIASADLLLHIVDISHRNAINQAEAVSQTLEEIEADHIPTITVLNKIDLLDNPNIAKEAIKQFPQSVAISATNGDGVADLLEMIRKILFEVYESIIVRLPYQEGQLISLFHQYGQVDRAESGRKYMIISGRIPGRFMAQFQPWKIKNFVLDLPEENDVSVDES